MKTYVAKQFGDEKAKACIREITLAVRQLETFPKAGSCLEEIIEYPTDYHYLIVKPNYIFYRIEGNIVRIIRILNEKQDFCRYFLGLAVFPKREKITGKSRTHGVWQLPYS